MTPRRSAPAKLERFCKDVLRASGADAQSADAAARAMLHASLYGVDSHGVRLLPHYDRVIRGGRVNGAPNMAFQRTSGAAGLLNADDAHGARAGYAAVDHVCDLAAEQGIGAVGIRNSSHFGAAGAYAVAITQRGMMGVVFCNSDSFVRLHDGAARFHGTNPIAVAVPTGEEHPWLLDMATSAVPYNRVQLYKSLGRELPDHTASDASGRDTRDPEDADMLAPLGGEFGFKGAGLAGMVEIFSAVLTGMRLSAEILPMPGPDFSTPREMGAFVMALDPNAFAGGEAVRDGMTRYLTALRASPARDGCTVMAPGDREWAEAARRRREGVPVDPDTAAEFDRLAEEEGIVPPFD
ncbi:Malate/lactate/ureidoglycolate dehydrogenase, LDH2 family [Palleronia marisminoris]|uniref:Putative oxidoreductase YjmC n=1 Tax=Palleronia marisminoris TaxID=315423 RepID=A0A1Y5SCB6_9RHOB|nr:Ldh family oxidoreductase [Palleronia marisminoris]SFG73318.1 Malate/lactate/ureidoglycolate dehydrogenase, LDH2 family [Palleronia marisminoris]SLN37499.1 putative oxidoreductase YjmC [Palleronia marisminoris]